MSDTFKELISDMRGEEPDVDEVSRDTVVAALDTYADRLEKLLDELNPYLLPMYGAVGAVGTATPLDSDPPPILADMLGSEPPPGSDWTLVHPDKPTIAEFLAREADEAEAAADGHVLSEPEQIEYPGGKDGLYVVTCSCGYATAPTSPALSAQLRADNHKAAADDPVTGDT